MSDTEQQQVANNLYTRTLCDIRNGDCLNEASNELGRLIQAVRETGRSGKLTIEMRIEPAGRGDVSRVFIEDTITAKIPKPQKARALFFTTEEGGLQRKDPNQTEMDLKVVSTKPDAALKEVPAEKTAAAS